jgi:5-methylthioadenosine/S-adenosylhomocysteine deaminase
MLRFFLLISISAACSIFGAETADWILTARYVVTMDARRSVIENGAVAVQGGFVAGVGTAAGIARRFTAGQSLDVPDAILIPGLINAHTHAPMALMRGVAGDVTLQDWLEKYIFPAEAKAVGPSFIRDGTRLACMEMLLSGITTFADMYYFEEVVAEATKECGMRAVLGQTIIGFRVADAPTPEAALERTEKFIEKYSNDPLITPAVAPHALYTNSEATLRASRKLANKHEVPLLIHLSETRKENEESLAKYGMSSTAVLDKWGILSGGHTLAAHGVWLDSNDIRILKHRGAGVAHCPSSNMMLASGIAPLPELLAADVAVGLGTDGPAGSNNDLSLFEEMDLAAKLQKVAHNDPIALTAVQAFEMATIRGARALGMEKAIGSIEAGKRADLTFVRLSAPHAQPMYNIYSQLVYALKASDVSHVMVDGRLVVRDRQVLGLNAAEVLKNVEGWRAKIRSAVSTPLF